MSLSGHESHFVSCPLTHPPQLTISLGAGSHFHSQEFNREDPEASCRTPLKSFELEPGVKATRVAFINYKGAMDGGIVVTLDDGRVQILDPSDGDILADEQLHTQEIMRISFNKEKTLLFTASKDNSAKMVDAESLEVLNVYQTDRPVNAVVCHPTKDHVILGGGQDAMSVTTTSGAVGKFECRFYESIYNVEFGRVKGHNGPINAIGINPDGRSYASGSEDGWIRLHYFDQDYIEREDPVPEEPIDEGEE